MTSDEKLARIARQLEVAGIDSLVMGGHAVRYYGIGRNTVDFDFVAGLNTPDQLRHRLLAVQPTLGVIREEPVWRRDDFVRFEIGRLPGGREEWLEFWLRNHLLDSFSSLKVRSEIGTYGGENIRFLALADLLRSKETERESDWEDIALLEEVQDARNLAAINPSAGPNTVVQALSQIRSRRGMEEAIRRHLLDDKDVARQAIPLCQHPVSLGFLLPAADNAFEVGSALIEPATFSLLRTAAFASPKHFGIIEICRRAFKRKAMEADRLDKQAKLHG